MAMLTLIDVSGIQNFIFGSNRLAENVGASYLVKATLDDWLKQLCRDHCKLLFSGGGKALVRSASTETARRLMTQLSERVILEAPGLTLFCAHTEWDETRDFAEVYAELHQRLRQNKDSHWPDPEFDGFGVIATAAPEDSPAISFDKKSQWTSLTGQARSQSRFQAERLLQDAFKLPGGYEWTNEMDRLGRSRGERSLLGVLHFDGNGMGQEFEKASRSLAELCELSANVDRAGERTLAGGLAWVAHNLPRLKDVLELNGYFPVRPILYGGDDITLVCDGRITLDLAAELLRHWEEATEAYLGKTCRACVGVALVPVRFPFFRAYEIAEQCCKRAKNWLRHEKLEVSALDWSLQSGGAVQDLEASSDGFTCKPYLLTQQTKWPYKEWNWFRHELVRQWSLLGYEDEEGRQRTQLKAMGEALRAGETESEAHIRRTQSVFKWRFPEPTGRPSLDGYFDGHTPYLDALELMDRVVPGLTKMVEISK